MYCYSAGRGRLLTERVEIDCRYDPRNRPWYSLATSLPSNTTSGVWTEPYIFTSSSHVGITFTQPLYKTIVTPDMNNGGNTSHTEKELIGVVGVDVSFEYLSKAMSEGRDPVHGSYFILDPYGYLISATDEMSTTKNHLGQVR